MKQRKFPLGWDDKRVKETLTHYVLQTEEEAVAEDEAAFEVADQAAMEIPVNLLLRLRKINLLSFAVKVPNAESIEALRQARSGKGLTEYADLESLKARHG